VSLRRAATLALLVAAVAAPEIAQACPMCMSGQGGGTGKAFAIGSFFLSVTPLAVIGGAVLYLRRRARALAAQEAAAAAPALPAERKAVSR